MTIDQIPPAPISEAAKQAAIDYCRGRKRPCLAEAAITEVVRCFAAFEEKILAAERERHAAEVAELKRQIELLPLVKRTLADQDAKIEGLTKQLASARRGTTKAAAKWLREHANDTESISGLDACVAMRLRRIASDLDAMDDGLPG